MESCKERKENDMKRNIANTLPEEPTIEEFYDAVIHHDWYSSFSDDHRKWRAGEEDMRKLMAFARRDPILDCILVDYAKHLNHNALMPTIDDYKRKEEGRKEEV